MDRELCTVDKQDSKKAQSEQGDGSEKIPTPARGRLEHADIIGGRRQIHGSAHSKQKLPRMATPAPGLFESSDRLSRKVGRETTHGRGRVPSKKRRHPSVLRARLQSRRLQT